MGDPGGAEASSGDPRSGIPRVVEAAAAALALLVAAPVLAVAGLITRLTSRGPALFRQDRVGLHGKRFVLYKLRTMRPGTGPQVTVGDDARITGFGKFLRRTKLDELPQLWNVLRGDMSLVGPRPEVPRYVEPENPLWERVLQARPGLTDPVTLTLRNEEELLSRVDADPEAFYLQTLQPWKLSQYVEYLARRSWLTDLAILLRTGRAVVWPRPISDAKLNEIFDSRGR